MKSSMYQQNNAMDVPVDLPNGLIGAYLDLYAVPKNNDEFCWSLQPDFREVEVYIYNRPAGVVWLELALYIGGVNPFLWRLIQGIHTLDITAYRVNLSPFRQVVP